LLQQTFFARRSAPPRADSERIYGNSVRRIAAHNAREGASSYI